MPGGAYWRQIRSITSAWYVAAATERVWKAATEASVTGSKRSRSYWHSTDTAVPATAAATFSSGVSGVRCFGAVIPKSPRSPS